MPRTKNVAVVSAAPPSMKLTAKYWMFSVKANPAPTSAPYTMPSTGPSKARRALRKITYTPSPLATSSTIGAWTTGATTSATKDESGPKAKSRARSNPSVMPIATKAPHAIAAATRPFGSGSQRSMIRTAKKTTARGTNARIMPMTEATGPRALRK